MYNHFLFDHTNNEMKQTWQIKDEERLLTNHSNFSVITKKSEAQQKAFELYKSKISAEKRSLSQLTNEKIYQIQQNDSLHNRMMDHLIFKQSPNKQPIYQSMQNLPLLKQGLDPLINYSIPFIKKRDQRKEMDNNTMYGSNFESFQTELNSKIQK